MDLTALKANYKPVNLGTAPVPKGRGGLTGFIEGAAKGIAHPFGYLLNAAIVNPTREIAAQVTGNKVAQKNAAKKSNVSLGLGESGTNIAQGLKTVGGNSAQALLNLAMPEAGSIGKQAALGAGFGASSALAQDNSTAENVLQGGIEGGLFGGAVGGVGKVLSKLGGGAEKVVANKGAKIADNKATQTAFDDAIQKAKEAEPYANIPKKAREGKNLNGTLDFFKSKLGMGTTPDVLQKGANIVTGTQGHVSGLMRELLTDAGSVPTESVMQKTKDALVKEAGQLGDVETKGTHANGVMRSVRDTLQGTAFGAGGNLSPKGSAPANAVFDSLKNIETRISELGTTGADAAEKRGLRAAKTALEDNLYNHEGLNKAVREFRYSPEEASNIHAIVQQAGGSPELADHIINGVNDAKTGQDLRSLQKPFVDASQLASESQKAVGGTLAKAPRSTASQGGLSSLLTGRGGRYNALEAAGLLGGNPVMALPLAANIKAALGQSTEKGALLKGAEKVVGGAQGANSVVPGGTANMLARLTTQVGARNAATAQPESAPPENNISGSLTLPNANVAPAETNNPFAGTTIQKAIIQDLANNDGKNVATLLKLYDTFGKPDTTNTNQKPNLQQRSLAQSGITSLGNLSDMISQNPSVVSRSATPGQGLPVIGGYVAKASGAAGYAAELNNVIDILSKLRTGKAATKAEQQLYKSQLPRAGDSPDVIQQKIATIQQAFAPFTEQ